MDNGLGSRAAAVARKKWFLPACVAAVVAVAFLQAFLFGADTAEVTRRLEVKYGVDEVVWRTNGRYERETLVVDGRDLSEECVVTGDWGPLDDLAIECDGQTRFAPVDR